VLAFFLHKQTIDHLLSSYGYPVIFGMVGIESLGVPVPGETTLILAALYAGTTGNLAIQWVVAAAAAGAIVGDNIGFAVGRFGGFALLRRYGPKLHIGRRRMKLGRYVFLEHGGKVVFFGRFVSVLRTWAAFLAGTNRMAWGRFLLFNAAGGIVWAAVYGVAYYYFGQALEGLQTTVDVALGALAAAILIGGLIFLKRKEREYEERAERELPDDALEELA
jgi:membrane protein DedA with SNARE-associated domain